MRAATTMQVVASRDGVESRLDSSNVAKLVITSAPSQ
jgi:hypothetical protein